MFNLFIALLTILFLAVAAEARTDVDGAIAAMLKNLDDAQSKDDDQASLNSANDKLQAYLSRADLRSDLMRDKLPNAVDAGLTVVTSDDKNLRVFSWDTCTGGTMHRFGTLALINAGGKLKTSDLASQHDSDPGSTYEHIDQITTANHKTVYLLRDLVIGSTLDRSRSVQAYVVQNDSLQPFPIFRTKTKNLDTISIDIEDDQAAPGDSDEIEITEKGHRVSIPLINKENKPTGKYLVYIFDGHNFVFSGTSK